MAVCKLSKDAKKSLRQFVSEIRKTSDDIFSFLENRLYEDVEVLHSKQIDRIEQKLENIRKLLELSLDKKKKKK